MNGWVAVLLTACGAPVDLLPEEVTLSTVAASKGPWNAGVPLTPPVHLPSTRSDRDTVAVHLALPAHGEVTWVDTPGGRSVLAWPPGTQADRVEEWGGRVVDVRGTRIDAAGRRWHHVYKPATPGTDPKMLGATWPADAPELTQIAVEAFLDALMQTEVGEARPDPERYRGQVAAKLDCEGCHALARPANEVAREHGLVARGTDAAGWFTPATVLDLQVALEAYGAWDRNLSDPHVSLSCAGEPLTKPAAGQGVHPRCPEGRVPTAHHDLEAALDADDPRAQALCESWHLITGRLAGGPPSDHPCAEAS